LLLNNIVVSRLLGPEGRGILATLIFIPTCVVIVTNLGFHLSATYLLSRKTYAPQHVFSAIFLLTGLLCLICAVIVVLFWPQVRSVVYKNLPEREMVVSLLSYPALLILFFFDSLWVAIDQMTALMYMRMTQCTVYFLSGIILIWWLRQGVLGGILSFTIGAWAAALVTIFCSLRIGKVLSFSRQAFWAGLRFGLSTHTGNVIDFVLYRMNIFLVIYLIGYEQVGYFSFAVPIAELIWFISTAIRPVLFSKTAQADAPEANKATSAVIRGVLASGAFVGVLAFLAG